MGMPPDPCLGVVEGQFRCHRPIRLIPCTARWLCLRQEFSYMWGSKSGGSPISPPAGWDQSTISSELLDSEKQLSPSMGCVRSTVSVVLIWVTGQRGGVIFFYLLRPVCWLEGSFPDCSPNSHLSKVTHHLGHTGLGESMCLLGYTGVGESVWLLGHTGLVEVCIHLLGVSQGCSLPQRVSVLRVWPADIFWSSWNSHGFKEHLLLPDCWWLLNCLLLQLPYSP